MLLKYGKSKTILIEGIELDYVEFGSGNKPFIILPGLSDGLKTVKGQAFTLSRYYKEFAKEFKVYVFSRKNQLRNGYTTKDMARDQKIAMEKLGIKDAYIMGISQGGMISQYLAIDHPEMVEKLILGVTVSKQNPTIQESVQNWIRLAEANDYGSLIIDTMKKTFTKEGIKKYRWLFPIISRVGKPKSFNRFIIQAKACLTHNAYDELNEIQCPTLVIGGDSDRVVGENTSEEMAERIKKSKLVIYSGLGHGAYEESKDFNRQVMRFLS